VTFRAGSQGKDRVACEQLLSMLTLPVRADAEWGVGCLMGIRVSGEVAQWHNTEPDFGGPGQTTALSKNAASC
jgi:hypothetical protein